MESLLGRHVTALTGTHYVNTAWAQGCRQPDQFGITHTRVPRTTQQRAARPVSRPTQVCSASQAAAPCQVHPSALGPFVPPVACVRRQSAPERLWEAACTREHDRRQFFQAPTHHYRAFCTRHKRHGCARQQRRRSKSKLAQTTSKKPKPMCWLHITVSAVPMCEKQQERARQQRRRPGKPVNP